MKLHLARHGNTFREQETAYFVGKEQDLPLVEEGERQAERVAEKFLQSGIKFSSVIAASLQRTTRFAEIIMEESHQSCSLTRDHRLDEISYGVWGGRTVQEIEELGYKAELDAWRSRSIWPQAVFSETQQSVQERVGSLLQECMNFPQNSSVLVVSSNGILRYFLYAVEGEFQRKQAQGKLAMQTGALSLLEYGQGVWQLHYWDERP